MKQFEAGQRVMVYHKEWREAIYLEPDKSSRRRPHAVQLIGQTIHCWCSDKDIKPLEPSSPKD